MNFSLVFDILENFQASELVSLHATVASYFSKKNLKLNLKYGPQ